MKNVKYGLIGAGGFGSFCIDVYSKIKNLEIVGVSDINFKNAEKIAKKYNIKNMNLDELLKETDIVHVATPPFTHYKLCMKALKKGCHVLCEKPLAINLKQAKNMIKLAKKKRKVLMVNFVMRYNPHCDAVNAIVKSNILGKPLRAFFENYAVNSTLKKDHWFWNKKKSGGIFVEHGVHFFDLFSSWFGKGEIKFSEEYFKDKVVDRVICEADYGFPVSFYHGFTNPKEMEEQLFRLNFEKGVIKMKEWIPTSLEIEFVGNKKEVKELQKRVPNSKTREIKSFEKILKMGNETKTDGKFLIKGKYGLNKDKLYRFCLDSLMRDMILKIKNKKHNTAVDCENGFESLRTAIDAEEEIDG